MVGPAGPPVVGPVVVGPAGPPVVGPPVDGPPGPGNWGFGVVGPPVPGPGGSPLGIKTGNAGLGSEGTRMTGLDPG